MTSERLITLMEILQVYADRFVKLASNLALFENLLETHDFTDAKNKSDLDFMVERLQALHALCVDGDLPMTKISVAEGLMGLSQYREPNANKVIVDRIAKHYFEELQGRLADELSIKIFFQLPHSRKELFEKPRAKWEAAIQRFPDSIRDIEEASKCFALSRYAACVFHCVQIVEHGLLKLGEFISVTDPISGWTAVASELKRIISKKYQDRNEFEKQHFSFIEQMQGTVEALKNAWRNKISHAHGQHLVLMSSDFTPDVAEDIMSATRAFMRRLADELPEKQ